MQLNWIVDPGHGWLIVDMSELEALKIKDEISSYSYHKDGIAYLEEDYDATVYLTAVMEQRGIPPVDLDSKVIHLNNDAPCRAYSRF